VTDAHNVTHICEGPVVLCKQCESPVLHRDGRWQHGLIVSASEYLALNVIAEAARSLLVTRDSDDTEAWAAIAKIALTETLFELASARS